MSDTTTPETQSIADYADTVEVRTLGYVTIDDEPVATIDIVLAAKLDPDTGKVTFDTDPVIESLGAIERNVLPAELEVRFNERNEDGRE